MNGDASTGAITDYTWTFKAANPGGAEPNSDATIHGSRSDVTFLGNTEVTLTVTNGRETDSRTQTISVLARDEIKTPYRFDAEEGVLTKDHGSGIKPTFFVLGGEMIGAIKGGECVCAIDISLPKPHWLHPNPDSAALDEMFTLKQVNDMGPWNGFYYLEEWKIKLETKTLLNR